MTNLKVSLHNLPGVTEEESKINLCREGGNLPQIFFPQLLIPTNESTVFQVKKERKEVVFKLRSRPKVQVIYGVSSHIALDTIILPTNCSNLVIANIPFVCESDIYLPSFFL